MSRIVLKVKGSLKFDLKYNEKVVKIDFTAPWKRISVMDELQKILDVSFPEDYDTEEANEFFDKLCENNKVPCGKPRTTARLIDKLIGEFIEPKITSPTFLINHPQIMCPLAKYHRSKPGLTERFELFVNGKELINAYTELNDPFVQKEQFEN